MKIAFIGDIVGRPGRVMVKEHLAHYKEEYKIDFVIANYENASHGFGLTAKNATELFNAGVDVMTGGNHSWDKKEILHLFDKFELIRPLNYPDSAPGTGSKVYEINGVKLAVINLMGHYTMPLVDNPFTKIEAEVSALEEQGIKNIFIDMHAEATSEKRALLFMLKDRVSGIVGTHTHVSTDDLQIYKDTLYLTDIGLTGCRDNVIGMDAKVPVQKFLTSIGGHFDVPKTCKKILQMVVFELDEGKCINALKIKRFDDGRELITQAWID